MGRPRIPDEIKKAKGTWRKDRAPTPPPSARPGAAPMPAGLPAAAALLWNDLAPRLVAAGMLAEVDAGALEVYVRSFVLWRELMASAAKDPILETRYGPRGRIQPLRSPASSAGRYSSPSSSPSDCITPPEAGCGRHRRRSPLMPSPTSSSRR